MSIRHGLLALLERGPSHGYQLRAEFDAATGATWPLNVGQVYTTLDRLERDGFVVQDGAPDADGRIAYRITDEGRAEVKAWFTSPVSPKAAPRDELAIKLALAVTTPGVDVISVVQTQRGATMTSLQELTRLKVRAGDGGGDLAWSLVLDSLVFRAEAEIRWLDHCEARVARAAAGRSAPAPVPPAPVAAAHQVRR
ncbi:PadR family transcriptional regulator [Blastococcus sp. CT_GayMR20]|uniref:PadR family transcriptional regulator n=1 Tax=Blastococcus sp. CT_GayMR20 TaxID=2559609 RepID=UPI00107398DD|nr:PadR family transcriptional regulator [Blastococcus sp. CT_GayMR20]TFV91799.1 PadR family transcriptional regulator [Blastococcus sp. CT_GayMR20]TFV91801.1 PadR family transcriptional regulator [Blastococcus sp. CT_GayMR20]